jgi:hypothetical protein
MSFIVKKHFASIVFRDGVTGRSGSTKDAPQPEPKLRMVFSKAIPLFRVMR